MPETYISVTDTAALLGVGRSTVYALMRSGELNYVYVTSRRRVPVSAIDAYLTARRPVGVEA